MNIYNFNNIIVLREILLKLKFNKRKINGK